MHILASKARTKRTTMTSAQRNAFLRCVCEVGNERKADVHLRGGLLFSMRKANRVDKKPLPKLCCTRFLRRFWPGLCLTVIGYMIVMAFRYGFLATHRMSSRWRACTNFFAFSPPPPPPRLFSSFRDFFAADVYNALLKREPKPYDYIVADWPGRRPPMPATRHVCSTSRGH